MMPTQSLVLRYLCCLFLISSNVMWQAAVILTCYSIVSLSLFLYSCTNPYINLICHSASIWSIVLESSWNVMAHGDTRKWKWRGDWRMEWVASSLHTTSEHGVSSITTADAHTSAASNRQNWCPCRFKWTHPFCRKTKSGFCTCAFTFETQSNIICLMLNFSSTLSL